MLNIYLLKSEVIILTFKTAQRPAFPIVVNSRAANKWFYRTPYKGITRHPFLNILFVLLNIMLALLTCLPSSPGPCALGEVDLSSSPQRVDAGWSNSTTVVPVNLQGTEFVIEIRSTLVNEAWGKLCSGVFWEMIFFFSGTDIQGW